MKIKTVSFILLLVISPLLVKAQTVTIKIDDKPVSEILAILSEHYDVFFSFSSNSLNSTRTSINVQNQPLSKVLQLLLEPLNLRAVKSKNNYYSIQPGLRRVVLKITEKENNTPVSYATVRSEASKRGQLANYHGYTVLTVDPSLDSTLVIQCMGFAKRVIALSDLPDDTLIIEMEVEALMLSEIIIEYHNEVITLKNFSEVKLYPEKMKVLPGLAEADVLLSVQMIPGVESNDETASSINVRSGGKEELLTYWDRIPIYHQSHFFGTLTSFIPNTSQEITVYKNYIPSFFTGATSGLLDIKVYDSIPSKASIYGNSNFTHTDLTIRAPLSDKVGLLLAGRLSYTNQFNSPFFRAQSDKLFEGKLDSDFLEEGEDNSDETFHEEQEETFLSYNDINAKLIVKPSKNDYISISGLISLDNFEHDISNDELFSNLRTNKVRFYGLNSYYSRNWTQKLSSKLSASQSIYEVEHLDELHEMEDDDEELFLTEISNGLNNLELKASLNYSGTKNTGISLGYQFNSYANFLNFIEENEFEKDIVDTLETTLIAHGAFISYKHTLYDKISITPELRIDRYSDLDVTLLNPVFNLNCQLFPSIFGKISYGHYAQLTRNLNESQLSASNVSQGLWLLADDDEIAMLRSKQLTIGVVYEQRGLLIDMDWYLKNTSGLSLINQFESNEDIAFLDFSNGIAQTMGLDLMIKKKFGRYQTWLSYTLSKTENVFKEWQKEPFYSALDRPQQLRWAHNYYFDQFELSLSIHIKSGTPYSRPDRIEEEVANDETFYKLVYDDINDYRLPVYHRMDFSVWYKFPRRNRKINGLVGLSIQNLYNRKNIWKRLYYIDDLHDDEDKPLVVEEERLFLRFSPNLSLKINFN